MRGRQKQKAGFDYGELAGLILIILSAITAMGLITGAQSTNASSAVLNTVCQVFNTIKNVIFILGLTLMLLGAAIYSGANLMPSQSRGAFQGYGMSMIVGGVVGVAIAVAAPFILNTVVKASGNTNVTVGGTTQTLNASSIPGLCAAAAAASQNSGGNNNGGGDYTYPND